MQWRVRDRQFAVARRVKAGDDVTSILLEESLRHVGVRRAAAIAERRRAGALSVTLHDLVVRRDDLSPVTCVKLVPVVLGRIVTRGDHDARRGVQRLHAVRHERCRKRRGHLVHHRPTTEENRNDFVIELLRSAPSVTADHDAATAVDADLLHPREHAEGRTSHRRAIHPGGTRHLRTAQSRSAEGQWRAKASFEFRLVVAREESGQRVAIVLVGIERDPRLNVVA